MAASCGGISISGVYQNNGIQISLQTPMGNGSTFIALPFCTKEECAANKGKPGPPGTQGKPGEPGKTGKQGPPGKKGAKGAKGDKGDKGEKGAKGDKGEQGIKGLQGIQGIQGLKGVDGKVGAQGPLGPTGPKGDKGSIGPYGAKGNTGPAGKNGKDGKAGSPGKTGPAGPAGAKGAKGNTGPTGPQGLTGLAGTVSSCAISLTWDNEADTLAVTLQVNDCNSNSNVEIPMDLAAVINLLEDIQGKVTVDAAIKKGVCNAPAEAGEWYEYAAGAPSTVDTFSDAFARLSDQLEAIHQDACKSVRPKKALSDIPRPPVCQVSTDAQGNTVYAIVDADDTALASIGWVLPWVLGNAAEKTVDWISERSLDWLFNFIKNQEKRALEAECKAIEQLEEPPIIGCLPKIAIDDSGGPLTDGAGNVIVDKNGFPVYPKKFNTVNVGGESIQIPVYDAANGEVEIRPLYPGELSTLLEEVHPDYTGDIEKVTDSLQNYLIMQRLCISNMVPNVPTIVCYDPSNPEHAEWADAEKTAGYQVVTTDPIPQPVAIQVLGNEIGKLNIKACQEDSGGDCQVLLPDPRAVWNTDGYYIFFYWKIQGASTPQEKNWRNVTQLTEPIEELLNPEDPTTIWGDYFSPIYKILGNQWGEVRAANKARRYPLYSGWFTDEDEGRRFFTSIEGLTQIPYASSNNPSFPQKDNQSVSLVNAGKTVVLRKVCVGLKHSDSDKVDFLQSYAPSS